MWQNCASTVVTWTKKLTGKPTITVGLSSFEEKGYNATGIQEIATKAEISESSEECRMELQGSIERYIEVLTNQITIGQSIGRVRTDLPAQRLAELLWDCWQGSLLRMKVKNSVDPVNNDLELLFRDILIAFNETAL